MSQTCRHKSGLCQSGLWIVYLTQNIKWIVIHFFEKNEWVNVWVNVLIILEITEINSNWYLREELVRRKKVKKKQ